MPSPTSALPSVTGSAILQIALQHVGEKYVLGIQVPKDNPNWKGPWDCAEFVSWSVFQAASVLYGCDKDSGVPASADAYTGYWERDSLSLGRIISLDEAARTPGGQRFCGFLKSAPPAISCFPTGLVERSKPTLLRTA